MEDEIAGGASLTKAVGRIDGEATEPEIMIGSDHAAALVTLNRPQALNALTTAMRADLVCVVADGQVVESGSHGQLLARGGLYAQSWSAQMECQPA